MQPIAAAWGRLPRVVRDLGREFGRQVRLDQEGEGTELDKSILEAIRDPLVHLVRHAVDRGIKPPERRAAAGKPAEGRILLRACHEAGKVAIEIQDDGAGIDPAQVRSKALELGLITAEQVARMSEREILALILAPDCSIPGMELVRTNIERIGGSVDIASQVGAGATIALRIPLTLAIIPRPGGPRRWRTLGHPPDQPGGTGPPRPRPRRHRHRGRLRCPPGPVPAAAPPRP